MREHHFQITVQTNDGTRRSAELALLLAFSTRQPDGCKFNLESTPPITATITASQEEASAILCGDHEKVNLFVLVQSSPGEYIATVYAAGIYYTGKGKTPLAAVAAAFEDYQSNQ